MAKASFKEGQVLGNWVLKYYINKGGNGEVWHARHKEVPTKVVAIKILRKNKGVDYKRFKDEVKVLSDNRDIMGLLPIIDLDLPDNIDEENGVFAWFAMPLATSLDEYIKQKSPEQIIDAIISVSETVIDLHSRNISHRDIKPANILVKNGEICLSDFGLVEYPDKEDLTVRMKDVGAKWTIAPEMRRNPDTADGKPADVYSLAKTLWILLTKERQGFEGQYSVSSSIDLAGFVSSIYLAPLDDLIHKSTDHEPKHRPTIIEFRGQLIKWKELNKDFEQRSKLEWVDIQNTLFPLVPPRTVTWSVCYF